MSERQVRTEWRVETDGTEDEFGTDEQEAREWLELCERKGWLPAALMRRTVTVEASAWERVK